MWKSHKRGRVATVVLVVALETFAALGGVGLGDTAAAATQTLTLKPVADSHVEEAKPSTNFGTATRLKTDGGRGVRIESVLRFDLSGVTGTVESARLRLPMTSNGTKDGPAVYPTGGDWTEGGVTWGTRPTASGPAVADLGVIPAGMWVEVDVTALAIGGSVNILLKQPGTDGVDFYSREAKYKPELIVTAAEAPSLPPLPPPPSPSFPRGIWMDSDVPSSELADAKGLGFGVAQVNPDRAQLDRVWAAGLRAIVWLGNYDDVNCRWNWSDEELSFKINATKDHPAIAYYFIADEPHSAASGGCASAPDDIRARNALVKVLHPGVPTFITENRRADFANLANTTDFMGLIRYPCSYSSGCVMSKITETINAANAAGIEHYWGVPQVFREPSGGYYRAPSASELKQIFATWEAEGSRIEGYLFYTWGRDCCGDDIGLADLPELWDTVKTENGDSVQAQLAVENAQPAGGGSTLTRLPPPQPPTATGPPALGASCTILGSPGRDVIRGTAGSDVICGEGGNDVIRGRGGDDLLVGGGGADKLYGGSGRDRIYGGTGADLLNGGAAGDWLYGGGGNDVFYARDGLRDTVDGSAGRDRARLDAVDRRTSIERRF